MSRAFDIIRKLIKEIGHAQDRWEIQPLLERHVAFFEKFLEGEYRAQWGSFLGEVQSSEGKYFSESLRQRLLGLLESILLFDEPPPQSGISDSQTKAATAQKLAKQALVMTKPRVFVVHGHDEAAKEAVARFLERLGLNAIVLHEQANSGKTIMEKFESHAGAEYSVVILSPDDIGSSVMNPNSQRKRARQNVVFEMGYFVGRLSRHRVCVLHKGDVEIPSDLSGLVYVELDTKGAWRAKLAQELVQASVPIDLQALLA